jgi:hypothetical protein
MCSNRTWRRGVNSGRARSTAASVTMPPASGSAYSKSMGQRNPVLAEVQVQVRLDTATAEQTVDAADEPAGR